MGKTILQDPWSLTSGDTDSILVDYRYTNSPYIENPVSAHLYFTIKWDVPPPPSGGANPYVGHANFKVFIKKPDGSGYEVFYSGEKGQGTGSEYHSIDVSAYFDQNGTYVLMTRIEVQSSWADFEDPITGELIRLYNHTTGWFDPQTQVIVSERVYLNVYDVLHLIESLLKRSLKRISEFIAFVENLFYSKTKVIFEVLSLSESYSKKIFKTISETISAIESYVAGMILTISETIYLVETHLTQYIYVKVISEAIKLVQVPVLWWQKTTSFFKERIRIIFNEKWDKIQRATDKWIRRLRRWL